MARESDLLSGVTGFSQFFNSHVCSFAKLLFLGETAKLLFLRGGYSQWSKCTSSKGHEQNSPEEGCHKKIREGSDETEKHISIWRKNVELQETWGKALQRAK